MPGGRPVDPEARWRRLAAVRAAYAGLLVLMYLALLAVVGGLAAIRWDPVLLPFFVPAVVGAVGAAGVAVANLRARSPAAAGGARALVRGCLGLVAVAAVGLAVTGVVRIADGGDPGAFGQWFVCLALLLPVVLAGYPTHRALVGR